MTEKTNKEGPIKQSQRRISSLVNRSDFSFIGIFFPQFWFYRILSQDPAYEGAIPLRTIIYCASIALFCVVFLLQFTSYQKEERPALNWLFACCMVAAPLLFALPAPSGIYVLAAILGGVGFAWTILQWGLLFSKVDTEVSVFYLFLSLGLDALLSLGISATTGLLVGAFMGPSTLLFLMASAFLSTGFALRGNKIADRNPVRVETRFDTETLSSFWKLFVGIGFFSFVFGYVGSSGMYEGTGFPILFQNVFDISVTVLAIYWVFSRRSTSYAFKLWSFVLLITAASLLLLALRENTTHSIGLMLLLTGQSFAKCLLLAILADIAHHSKWHPYTVFSAGSVLFALPLITGSALKSALTGLEFMNFDLMTALTLLAFSLILLLNSSNFSRHKIFFDLEEHSSEASLEENIDGICRKLAQEHRLSLREEEVLAMLARGRSRTYIASAFFISENTAKGHIKNIYAKMNIHSKQELLDIFYGSLKEHYYR